MAQKFSSGYSHGRGNREEQIMQAINWGLEFAASRNQSSSHRKKSKLSQALFIAQQVNKFKNGSTRGTGFRRGKSADYHQGYDRGFQDGMRQAGGSRPGYSKPTGGFFGGFGQGSAQQQNPYSLTHHGYNPYNEHQRGTSSQSAGLYAAEQLARHLPTVLKMMKKK